MFTIGILKSTSICNAKSSKYRGIFKKCQENTRQARENWSQHLEHKQVQKGTQPSDTM